MAGRGSITNYLYIKHAEPDTGEESTVLCVINTFDLRLYCEWLEGTYLRRGDQVWVRSSDRVALGQLHRWTILSVNHLKYIKLQQSILPSID